MDRERPPKRTSAAEGFTQLILETFRLNGQLLAAGDRLVKDLDLTSALWQVLGAIEDKPLTMAQIARSMGLTRQSVRRSVQVLQSRGFVEFSENPDHQRAKLVGITPKGSRVLAQVDNLQIAWANGLAEDLDLAGLNTAIQLMKKINQKL